MKVTIAIPIVSFGRLSLLLDEVKSIQMGTYKNVHVVIVIDGNLRLYETIKTELSLPNISIVRNKKRLYWIASVNRVWKEFDSDYYIYSADDVTFPSNCIEHAMETMQECFPDGFGLIGLTRRKKAGFGLFGRLWADFFPDRQVLCPDYLQYGADREITQFAEEIGKYDVLGKRRFRVTHHKIEYDETWKIAKEILRIDPAIRKMRREQGFLWGADFNRLVK